MRKLVLTEFISIDGVVDEPHLWHFPFWSDEMGAFKLKEMMETDLLLLGRITYEGFAAAWPNYTDEDGFADRMNGIPKYVVSTTITPEQATWNNSHIISENVEDAIRELKQGDGQDIQIAGSVTLANALLDSDLIDEYRLMVHPIVVGKGKRLFTERATSKALNLIRTEALPNGVMVMVYAPAQAERDGTAPSSVGQDTQDS